MENRTYVSFLNTKTLVRSRRGWKTFWTALFEALLEGWVRDEAFWPED